jgi:hypothetical protein
MVYPLLHVGVHELPLARLEVHVPTAPFVGAVAALHGFGLHSKLSLNVPYEHDLLPDAVYPLLHVGVHEAALSRLDGHVPMAPFVGAETVHGLPAQRKTVLRDSVHEPGRPVGSATAAVALGPNPKSTT